MRRTCGIRKDCIPSSTHVLESGRIMLTAVAIINKETSHVLKGDLDEMRDHFKPMKSLEKMFLEMTGQ